MQSGISANGFSFFSAGVVPRVVRISPHNPKVGGSNPPPATNLFSQLQAFPITSPAHFPLTLPRAALQPAHALPVSVH
jgi:hypothetical protein